MRLRDRTFIAAGLVSMCLASALAGAQEIEEVTVTAQKRSEDLQQAPIAISALTQGMIEKRGMTGFREWTDYVPGITMYQGQDPSRRTGPSATIRGVTQVTRGQLWEVSTNSTTSFTIGQVPFFNADPGLYDLTRVEVLRGPQGTLQGISSMGGTVRFIPNEADTKNFDADVTAGAGTIYQGGMTNEVGFMVNLPLVDNVFAIRLAGQRLENGGYVDLIKHSLSETAPLVIDRRDYTQADNTRLTIKNANKMEKTGGRISATFTPNDVFSLRAFTNWQRTEYDTTSIADLNTFSVGPVLNRFAMQPLTEDFVVSSIEASYDLGFASVEYVGGMYTGKNSETTENTPQIPTLLAGAVPILDRDGPGGLPADPFPSASSFPFETRSKIYTSELRLQAQDKSLFGSGMKFDYILGLFYQDEDRSGVFTVSVPDWNLNRGPNTVPILTERGVILASNGGGHYQNKAAFVDVTLHFTPKWSLGLGVRYFDQAFHSAEYRFGDFYSGKAANGATVGDNLYLLDTPVNVGQIKEDGYTPRAILSYQYDDSKLIYLSAAQGKRLAQGFPNPNGLANNFPQCTQLAQDLGILGDLQNGTTTDSVWSYDLGLKSKWLDNRLLVNTSLFYLVWADQQQAISLLAFDSLCNAQIPANVGEVTSKGIELEVIYAPTEHWNFNTAIAYTDAEFTDILPGVASSLPGVFLKKGDSVRMVAPLTASVGAEYRYTPPVFRETSFDGYVRADFRYVDERMNNFGDEARLKADPTRSRFFAPAYNLTDVRAGLDSEKLDLSLYVQNIFDRRAIYESSQEVFQPNIQSGSISQPRTIGFTVKKRF